MNRALEKYAVLVYTSYSPHIQSAKTNNLHYKADIIAFDAQPFESFMQHQTGYTTQITLIIFDLEFSRLL